MLFTIVAFLAAIMFFAVAAETATGKTYTGPCKRVHTTAEHAHDLRIAFSPSRWRDPSPATAEDKHHLARNRKCAYNAKARAKMKRMGEAAQERPAAVYRDKISPPGAAYLRSIRACESGSSGGYRADTGNGFYGAYQFDLQTWRSVGGKGNPAHAKPREQDFRAAKLFRSRGSSPWPVCG